MAVKNAVLLGRAQPRKQRQHLGVAHHRLVAEVLAQVVCRLANLTLTGQKHQDVALVVRVTPQFVHAIGNRVVQVVFAALFKRPVALLHREHAAGHHDHRRRAFGRFEVIRKTLRVDRGRGHDDLQIWPARQDLAQVAQQKVDVQRALVRFVDDDGVIGVEQRIGLRLSQQDAIGHQLDRCVFGESVLKPHLEAHHIAQWRLQFFSNALGHAGGGNAARLGMSDQLAALAFGVVELAPAHGQRDLGELRGLARTGFPADDDDLVRGNGVHDFVAFARHRERLWEFDLQGAGSQGLVFVENCGLSQP